jgi:hypothetical protein
VVTGGGAGSSLLKDPTQLQALVAALVAAVGSRVPVTVKMRSGFNDSALFEDNLLAVQVRASTAGSRVCRGLHHTAGAARAPRVHAVSWCDGTCTRMRLPRRRRARQAWPYTHAPSSSPTPAGQTGRSSRSPSSGCTYRWWATATSCAWRQPCSCIVRRALTAS